MKSINSLPNHEIKKVPIKKQQVKLVDFSLALAYKSI